MRQQDQCWSAQDQRQVIGRAWRTPQSHIVQVVHILALETTDVIVGSMAMGKKDMLEAFTRNGSSKG